MLNLLKKITTGRSDNGRKTICSVEELLDMETRGLRQVTIGGMLIFVTTDRKVDPGPEYCIQPSRSGIKGVPLWAMGKKKREKMLCMNLWLHRSVLQKMQELPKRIQWIALQDYYLEWGLRQKKPTILVGGALRNYGINLEIFRFKDGKLEELQEYECDYNDNDDHGKMRAETNLSSILTDWQLRYPDYEVAWSDPLPKMDKLLARHRVASILDAPFNHFLWRVLAEEKKTVNAQFSIKQYLPLVVMLLLAVGFYIGALVIGQKRYDVAVQNYRVEVTPVQKQYEHGEQSLEILESQRVFLSKEKLAARVVQDVMDTINVLGGYPDLVIEQMVFAMPSTEGEQKTSLKPDEDFQLQVKIPASAGQNSLEQARPLLEKFSAELRADMHIMRYQEVNQKVYGQPTIYRKYQIHGQFLAEDKKEGGQ